MEVNAGGAPITFLQLAKTAHCSPFFLPALPTKFKLGSPWRAAPYTPGILASSLVQVGRGKSGEAVSALFGTFCVITPPPPFYPGTSIFFLPVGH